MCSKITISEPNITEFSISHSLSSLCKLPLSILTIQGKSVRTGPVLDSDLLT